VFLARIRNSGSCRELEAEIFGAYPLLGVFIISPKVSSQGPKWFGRSVDRKFGVEPRAIFWATPGDPPPYGRVTLGGIDLLVRLLPI
jgi:hypothetical protein